MQHNNFSPASLYSASSDILISLTKNSQFDLKKSYIPQAIQIDLCFKDLFTRSVSTTTEAIILETHKDHRFKDLLKKLTDKTVKPRLSSTCVNKCCTVPAPIVFAEGPAALIDRHNLLVHKKPANAMEYTEILRINICFYLFVQRLYEYSGNATIPEYIRKNVSFIFINTFNSITTQNLKEFAKTCNFLREILERLQQIAKQDIKLHPYIYVICIKNFMELVTHKKETILIANRYPDIPLKCKELLKNNKFTPETFIDLFYQNHAKTELLKANAEFNKYLPIE